MSTASPCGAISTRNSWRPISRPALFSPAKVRTAVLSNIHADQSGIVGLTWHLHNPGCILQSLELQSNKNYQEKLLRSNFK